jgi:transposase
LTSLLEGRNEDTETGIHDEFKELAVKRIKDGQSISMVCKELGLSDQTVRNWVKAAAEGKLNGAGGRVVTPEEMELSRLRAENLRLKRENEILKKATAYFARDVL